MVTETLSVAAPSTEEVNEMDKLMSDGKRNYVCNQPHLALDCFVELCEKMSKLYGQESEKCVDAYLYYGKTLLEIARLENGVLGHAIKEMPVFGSGGETDDQDTEKEVNTEDEDDGTPKLKSDEIRSCVERALREDNLYNESTEEEEGDNTEEEGDDDVIKDEDVEKKEAASAEKADSGDATPSYSTAGSSSANIPKAVTEADVNEAKKEEGMEVDDGIECDGSDDDNDDISNLELAWEMLELSSVILRRELKKDASDTHTINNKLAEAKYGLAQISLEAGRYQDSVNDFTECLDIYKKVIEDKNCRVIAEGHYNIALALSLDKRYDDAIQGYQMAVKILKARVEDLEARVKVMDEKKDKTDGDLAQLREWTEEVAELNDLIVLDMMTKIEDAEEAKKLAAESVGSGDVSGTASGFDAGFGEANSANPANEIVNDCSSNIRSVKRKSDDEMSDGCDKKVKGSDEGVEETASKPE